MWGIYIYIDIDINITTLSSGKFFAWEHLSIGRWCDGLCHWGLDLMGHSVQVRAVSVALWADLTNESDSQVNLLQRTSRRRFGTTAMKACLNNRKSDPFWMILESAWIGNKDLQICESSPFENSADLASENCHHPRKSPHLWWKWFLKPTTWNKDGGSYSLLYVGSTSMHMRCVKLLQAATNLYYTIQHNYTWNRVYIYIYQ